MKENIKFEYDDFTDNMYVSLARFKHKTTGTIAELAPEVNAMIDYDKKRVIGILVTNYNEVAASYFDGKNAQTSTTMFNVRLLQVAVAIDKYYEDEGLKAPIEKINRSMIKLLAA